TDSNARADMLFELNETTPSWFGTGGGNQYLQGVIKLAKTDKGETLTGTDKDDTLVGGDGNDIFITGAGNDRINGGKGNDTVRLPHPAGDYSLVVDGERATLTIGERTITLLSIEELEFADGSRVPVAP
ncbi:MAG: hypothetical protein ACO1OG_04520, partial [Devosia sp.]